jgi:hypothetical protein
MVDSGVKWRHNDAVGRPTVRVVRQRRTGSHDARKARRET